MRWFLLPALADRLGTRHSWSTCSLRFCLIGWQHANINGSQKWLLEACPAVGLLKICKHLEIEKYNGLSY